tara:strand:+ start:3682 stop:5004 length:1323 start_codon:yes stop_codon:yes gene_type:complete
MTKKIVLLGAGRSSSYLIKYLYNNRFQLNISLVIISDIQPTFLNGYNDIKFMSIDVNDNDNINSIIKNSFLVVSLLPPGFHFMIAKICSDLGVNMITASYLDNNIKSLEKSFIKNKCFLFMEMGLDPGIDHMSAMKIINDLKKDSQILEFESYTGGLIKDNYKKNPWGYKFTWNPSNVILAGIDNARYIEKGRLKFIPYNNLFKDHKEIIINNKIYEGYPNRDSVKYKKLYGLNNIKTLRRGTLRNKSFCNTWDLIINIGLTNNNIEIKNSNKMTFFDFFNLNLKAKSLNHLNSVLEKDYNIKPSSDEYKNLKWSGFFSNKILRLDKGFASDFLLEILNDKWRLESTDIDLIIMCHSFIFKKNNNLKKLTSFLKVEGEDNINTAMSKTVGMPIALLIEQIIIKKYKKPGIHLPFDQEIYIPILSKMSNLGLVFEEKITSI